MSVMKVTNHYLKTIVGCNATVLIMEIFAVSVKKCSVLSQINDVFNLLPKISFIRLFI